MVAQFSCNICLLLTIGLTLWTVVTQLMLFTWISRKCLTVTHICLLSKLHSYGFGDPLLGWLKSFLIGRRQGVCVHDTVSLWHNVTSGIPQGSVLRPVLFLLYINDLPDNVASNVYMFADNTKIYRPMTSHEDTTILQNDLDCLQSLSAKWLLNFNLHKCKVMSITKSTAFSHYNANYYLKTKALRLAAHQFFVAPKK